MNQLDNRSLAYLSLFTGLSISAVAIYYSVAGLIAIFSASPIPIIIMGVVLEIGKLVATIWLKQNWSESPRAIKVYLMSAIILLMLITSMGIFGFLSKAHSDQGLMISSYTSKLLEYDEKIKFTQENIENKRRELKQMDEAVDQIMARSQDQAGASKSVALRKSQQKSRDRISKEIEAEQKKISELNTEAAPLREKVRSVEAEIGPIKYIANFIYGDTEEKILEKSVSWVIILLILVFDPLAIVLLLASQYSFQQIDSQEKSISRNYEKDDGPLTADQLKQLSDGSIKPTKLEPEKKIQIKVKETRGGEVLVDYYLKMIKTNQLTLDQVPTQQLRQKIENILNEK